ncbi:MAG: hypothetical protein FWD31_02115 [Planctomycetaceae bacterium]|nr:hypothetical protein [Planctomycetaceae bacterium]
MKKSTFYYWTAIFLLQVAMIAYWKGLLIPPPGPTPKPTELVLTAKQAKLVREAIEQVRESLAMGHFTETGQVLEALYGAMPKDCRDRVLQKLGFPEMGAMRDQLDILLSEIIIKD